ncbi:MAG TPA: hypothetical protein PKD50_12600, partial [Leptospiraceae bacterium]|nr:hypothetical protein [Leptospiraceae bacterium]
MMKILLSLFLFFITSYLFAIEIIPYKKIDETLKTTWDNTYPVEFKKVIKKDLLGKGIMVT